MDITIAFPDAMASKFKARIAGVGRTGSSYATQLIAETLTIPATVQLPVSTQVDFVKAGKPENELLKLDRQ